MVLTRDAEQAREIGRETVDFYLNLSNYLNNWKRLGFTDDDIAKPGSDKLIDAVVAHGTPDAIAARLTEHLDAGADHVTIQVLGGKDALLPTLAELAGPLGLSAKGSTRRPLGFDHAVAGHRRRRIHRRQLRARRGARAPRGRGDGARRHDLRGQPRVAGPGAGRRSGWCRATSPTPSWSTSWSPNPTPSCTSPPKPTSTTRWPIPEPFLRTNVIGTFTVLEAVRQQRGSAAPRVDRRGVRRSGARRPAAVHRSHAVQPVEPVLVDQGRRRHAGAVLGAVLRRARDHLELLQQLRAVSARGEVHPAPDHQRADRPAAQAVRHRRQRARLDPRRRPQQRGVADPRRRRDRPDVSDRRRRRTRQPVGDAHGAAADGPRPRRLRPRHRPRRPRPALCDRPVGAARRTGLGATAHRLRGRPARHDRLVPQQRILVAAR